MPGYPECRRCGRVQATAEVRRTKLGFVCKEKIACARWRREREAQQQLELEAGRAA